MRETIGLAICGLVLAGATPARSTEATVEERTPVATAEEELRSLEQEWVDAEVRGHAVALRRILDEKFIATVGAGPPLGREAFIQAVVSGASAEVTHTLSDSSLVVDHDTAIVVGTDTVRGGASGGRFVHTYRYTATYVRREGRWIALGEHLVRAPDEP